MPVRSVERFPDLAATSWAVLGMLAFGEELTGNDLKKWADWSIGFFYWSPSVSQVYTELKKLEKQSLVRSRQVSEEGVRGKRVYSITETGVAALREWSLDTRVETPILKHSVMLRLWMGHLHDPEQLKQIVSAHIENLQNLAERARGHAEHSESEPAWAFSEMSLRWSQRYYEAEIELSRQLLDDIDEAAEKFRAEAVCDANGIPIPRKPGTWRSDSADGADLR